MSDSIDHVRADLRRRQYLSSPHRAVEYVTGVGGDYMHPEFVNFDVLARQNYSAFKARLIGENSDPHRLCIEPSDDSVENLSKAELVNALTAKIASSVTGAERDDRLKEVRRANAKSKAALRELWTEVMGGFCESESDYAYDVDG